MIRKINLICLILMVLSAACIPLMRLTNAESTEIKVLPNRLSYRPPNCEYEEVIDEYLKEGYIFDVSDVLKPLTHENIIVILLGILLIYTFLKRYLKFA